MGAGGGGPSLTGGEGDALLAAQQSIQRVIREIRRAILEHI